MAPVDWPQFHFDASHVGWNQSEHKLKVSNVGNLTVKWSKVLRTGGDLSPVLAQDVLYVGTDTHGYLYALDAKDGQLLWYRHALRDFPITSAPAVANGIVYVGTARADDGGGQHGIILAVDAESGARIWAKTTAGAIYGAPCVDGNVVYVANAIRANDQASPSGCVYALDASSGSKLGKHLTADWVLGSPTVSGDLLYFSCADHSVYAVDKTNLNNQSPAWSHSFGNLEPWNTPAVDGDVVYVTAGPDVNCLHPQNPTLDWTYTTQDKILSSPAVAGGVVYVGSTDKQVYAIHDGNLVWPEPVLTGGEIRSSPAVANGVVYVGSSDHHLYVIDAATGDLLNPNLDAGDPVISSPAVANGVVYVGSGTDQTHGYITAYDLH